MPKKVDRNQPEIVEALRKIGATVQPLHAVGKGCPDILVGYRGFNYLIEIKDGEKPPSQTNLTPDQAIWHDSWQGQKDIAYSIEDAIYLVTGKQAT